VIYSRYMRLFGQRQTKAYVGVDIGGGGVKVVELQNEKGRARLLTYGYSERRPGEDPVPFLEDPAASARLLAQVCKRSGISSTKAVAALPLSSVFTAVISVPREKDERLVKEAVTAQAAKLMPLPLEEMITYSTFIDSFKANRKKEAREEVPSNRMRVLVTGAAKSLVQRYVELFRAAKLDLQALDTEAFGLIRSLVGKDRSTVLILDMGYLRTNMVVVERGIPFLSRSINVGGEAVTKRLAAQLGVEAREAEQAKRDLEVTTSQALPPVLEAVLQPIVNEVRYAFELYTRMEWNETKQVEKVILTGGSSHLPRFAEHLSQALNRNVYVGDPWARVIVPEEIRPVLDEVGPRLSVSVGLAMRDLD